MVIRIFVTGGTFDKEYNELNGHLILKDTHVKEMLKIGRSRLDLKIKTLMMIDSLDMSKIDHHHIAEQCAKAKEKKIVITHGTDTMVETAKTIAKLVRNKTIVLTGAMIPYSFGNSDAPFNLGAALAYVQSMPQGVYIAMNGHFFNWNNVHKNRKKGRFDRIR